MTTILPPELSFLGIGSADDIAKLNVPTRIDVSGRQVSLLDTRHREHLYKMIRSDSARLIPDDDFIQDALDRLPNPEVRTVEDLHPDLMAKAEELVMFTETLGPLHVLRTTRVTDLADELQYQWSIDDQVIFPLKNTSEGADPNFTRLPSSPKVALLINWILYHMSHLYKPGVGGMSLKHSGTSLSDITGDVWAGASCSIRISHLTMPLLPSQAGFKTPGLVYDDLTPNDGPHSELIAYYTLSTPCLRAQGPHLPKKTNQGWLRSTLFRIQSDTDKDGIAVAGALGFILPVPSVEPRDRSTATHMSTAERAATVRLMHRMAKQKAAGTKGSMQCGLCEFGDERNHRGQRRVRAGC